MLNLWLEKLCLFYRFSLHFGFNLNNFLGNKVNRRWLPWTCPKVWNWLHWFIVSKRRWHFLNNKYKQYITYILFLLSSKGNDIALGFTRTTEVKAAQSDVLVKDFKDMDSLETGRPKSMAVNNTVFWCWFISRFIEQWRMQFFFMFVKDITTFVNEIVCSWVEVLK